MKALAEAVVERAVRVGLTWRLRPATVVGPAEAGGVRGLYDGDVAPIRMVSMVGRLPRGARVWVLCTPPAGNHVVGFIDAGLQVGEFPWSVSAGWGSAGSSHQLVGASCHVTLTAVRTGAAITANAQGNITDSTVGTIVEESLRPAMTVVQTFRGVTTSGAVQANAAGSVVLLDMHPGSTIGTGDTVTATLVYPIAGV
ncbi:hypothetical protein [Micromonospora sp. HNM0581]|uniref:hypothetical protein n=1 Tax=Micromonospora sp. HNM0581 TaxID=2716341 RepID=UPI00146B72AE|nr:hypothetical protein [Micromonospora sp. HNM0581]